MSTESTEPIAPGYRIYTRFTLLFYDFVVLELSNTWIWKCPTDQLLTQYNTYASSNHLDIGVGTGYFLDRTRFPHDHPRLALMDVNAHCLEYATRRLARYSPETFRFNILDRLPLSIRKFDSVAVNYLLHCLPGGMAEKRIVFENVSRLLNPGGIVFGSTLLGAGVERNFAAKQLMRYYNHRGVFSNGQDEPRALDTVFRGIFPKASIQTIGCVALFRARKSEDGDSRGQTK